MTGGMRKKQLMTSFLKHLTKNPKKKKNAICISFKPKGCFKTYFYYTRLYKGSFTKEAIDSTLQKVMPFTENNENTIRTVFQFHDPKLIQAGCFKPYVYYRRLCTGHLRKKELIASFAELFKENHENTISVCFQFYIPKLTQERCFILSLLYGTMCRVLYERNNCRILFAEYFNFLLYYMHRFSVS